MPPPVESRIAALPDPLDTRLLFVIAKGRLQGGLAQLTCIPEPLGSPTPEIQTPNTWSAQPAIEPLFANIQFPMTLISLTSPDPPGSLTPTPAPKLNGTESK